MSNVNLRSGAPCTWRRRRRSATEHHLNTIKRSPGAQNENWAFSIARTRSTKTPCVLLSIDRRIPKLDVGSNVCHATERLHDNPQRPLIETNRVAIALNAAIDTSDNFSVIHTSRTGWCFGNGQTLKAKPADH